MSVNLAMAGLAEAAFARGLLLQWLLLIPAFVLVIVGLWRRSLIMAALACAGCILVAVLFYPWAAFRPAEFPNDSDEIYWLIRYRIAAIAWLVVCTSCTVAMFRAFRRKKGNVVCST